MTTGNETVTTENQKDTVFLIGRIERAVDEVDKHLAAGREQVIVDFSAVTFISVEGLEWLEEFLLRAESQGATVRFVNIPNNQYKVFKVARIERISKACGAPPQIGAVC